MDADGEGINPWFLRSNFLFGIGHQMFSYQIFQYISPAVNFDSVQFYLLSLLPAASQPSLLLHFLPRGKRENAREGLIVLLIWFAVLYRVNFERFAGFIHRCNVKANHWDRVVLIVNINVRNMHVKRSYCAIFCFFLNVECLKGWHTVRYTHRNTWHYWRYLSLVDQQHP